MDEKKMDEKTFFSKPIEERIWREVPRNFHWGVVLGFILMLLHLVSHGDILSFNVAPCGLYAALVWGIGDGLLKRMGVAAGIVSAISAGADAGSIPAVVILAECITCFVS